MYFVSHPKEFHSIMNLKKDHSYHMSLGKDNYIFFSKAIEKILCFSKDKVFIYKNNTPQDEEYTTLQFHEGFSLHYVSLSYDGEYAFVLTQNSNATECYIFNVRSKLLNMIYGLEYSPSDFYKAEFSKDSQKIAIATTYKTDSTNKDTKNFKIEIIPLDHPENIETFTVPNLEPSTITWNPAGDLLAFSVNSQRNSLDSEIFIHPVGYENLSSFRPFTCESKVISLEWSPSSDIISMLDEEGKISIFSFSDESTGSSLKKIDVGDDATYTDDPQNLIPQIFWSRLKDDLTFFMINYRSHEVHVFELQEESFQEQLRKSGLESSSAFWHAQDSSNLFKLLSRILLFSFPFVSLLHYKRSQSILSSISLIILFSLFFIIFYGIHSFIWSLSQRYKTMPNSVFNSFEIITMSYVAISLSIVWRHWDSIKITIFMADDSLFFGLNSYLVLLLQLFCLYFLISVVLFIFSQRKSSKLHLPNHFSFFFFHKSQENNDNAPQLVNNSQETSEKQTKREHLTSINSTSYFPPSVTPYGMKVINYYNKISQGKTETKNAGFGFGKTSTSNKTDSAKPTDLSRSSLSKLSHQSSNSGESLKMGPTSSLQNIQKDAKSLYKQEEERRRKEEEEERKKREEEERKRKEEEEEAERKRKEEEKQTQEAPKNQPKFSFSMGEGFGGTLSTGATNLFGQNANKPTIALGQSQQPNSSSKKPNPFTQVQSPSSSGSNPNTLLNSFKLSSTQPK